MSGRAIWIVLGIAKPPLLTLSSDGSTLFPSTSILTSDDAVISSYSMPKRLIRKWFCGPRTRAVMRVLNQVRPAEQVDKPIAGSEIDPGLQLGLSHVASGYCGDGHATVL